MDPKISGVGADQLSIIIPIIREPTAHNQYQLLESCESIILLVLTPLGLCFQTRPNVWSEHRRRRARADDEEAARQDRGRGGRWSIVAARPHLETGHEEWLRWRDPERQAVAGAHLQGREEAVGHRGHV